MPNAAIYRDTWAKHHGRKVRIDGLIHTIEVREWEAIYPYKRKVIKVDALPNRNTKHYREVKRQLGDHWSTDVLESDISLQCEILAQLE